MAVNEHNSNDAFSPQGGDSRVAGERGGNAFAGATFSEGGVGGTPQGAGDFLSLMSRISINQIDPTVEPYLKAVLAIIVEKMPGVELVNLSDRVPNAYAYKYDGQDGISHFFALYFAPPGESGGPHMYPTSARLVRVKEEVKRRFGAKARIHDGRVMISGYQPEMERTMQMARTIIAVFNIMLDSSIRNTTVKLMLGTEFVAETNVAAVRREESLMSPHGVRPRIDVGLVLKVRIRNENTRPGLRDESEEYQTLGVIGGYTEIYDREPVQGPNGMPEERYKPVFHVTTLMSIFPIPAIGMLLIASIAQSVYQTNFTARQWFELGENRPNPGMLLEDPHKPGSPVKLTSQAELLEFIRAYFQRSEISLQFLDGRDNIPGMLNMVAPDPAERNSFVRQLSNFFEIEPQDIGNGVLATVIEQRYEGVYGDASGTLHDSRDVDYLFLAAKNGWASIDDQMRGILLGSAMSTATDRALLTNRMIGGFSPLWLESIAVLNLDFLNWFSTQMIRAGLILTNPHAPQERRSIGQALNGFAQDRTVQSVFTNNPTGRGAAQINSVWFS